MVSPEVPVTRKETEMANYRLKIVRGEQEFEAEGDKKFVLEMLKHFERSAPAEARKQVNVDDLPADKSGTLQPSKSLSLREFIRRLGVKKHTDILVGFAYYLEKFQGVSEFTPADITNCYYEAKMETSNTSQMIIQNTRRGFVMAAKGASKGGRYTLTASGEKFVEQRLGAPATE
jgi:hypothetical protein